MRLVLSATCLKAKRREAPSWPKAGLSAVSACKGSCRASTFKLHTAAMHQLQSLTDRGKSPSTGHTCAMGEAAASSAMHKASSEVIAEAISAKLSTEPSPNLWNWWWINFEREFLRASFVLAAWSHDTGLGSSGFRVTIHRQTLKRPRNIHLSSVSLARPINLRRAAHAYEQAVPIRHPCLNCRVTATAEWRRRGTGDVHLGYVIVENLHAVSLPDSRLLAYGWALWHLMLRRTHQPTMVLSAHEAAAETVPRSPVSVKLLPTPVEAAAFAPYRSQPHSLYSSHSEAEPHDRGDELILMLVLSAKPACRCLSQAGCVICNISHACHAAAALLLQDYSSLTICVRCDASTLW